MNLRFEKYFVRIVKCAFEVDEESTAQTTELQPALENVFTLNDKRYDRSGENKSSSEIWAKSIGRSVFDEEDHQSAT